MSQLLSHEIFASRFQLLTLVQVYREIISPLKGDFAFLWRRWLFFVASVIIPYLCFNIVGPARQTCKSPVMLRLYLLHFYLFFLKINFIRILLFFHVLQIWFFLCVTTGNHPQHTWSSHFFNWENHTACNIDNWSDTVNSMIALMAR